MLGIEIVALDPGSEAGAVLDARQMLEQAERLCHEGCVIAADGSRLHIAAETLCVHGDNPASVQAVQALRALVAGG